MLRRKDSLLDRLYRWRGVLAITALPAVVVFVFLLLTPSGLRPGGVHEAMGDEQYSVVFDAGSTGSRIHIFKFVTTRDGYDLVSDTFEQLKPGLGDAGWAADAPRSAGSLQPLLDLALATVPPQMQASTPIELRATAGLRLLPGAQSADILAEITRTLTASPFVLAPDGVSIMDGIDEGAYAWMTLNYLLGKIGRPASELVAAIDLGGGSVQQAFAVDPATVKDAPAGYIRSMSGGGQQYSVYVYSYLGYGLMQGRGAVLTVPGSDTCVNLGTDLTYKSPYGGEEYALKGGETGGDFSKCAKVVQTALKMNTDCGVAASECSFNGVWGGGPAPVLRTYYVSSYFFDRALDAGIIKDKDAKSQVVPAKAFMRAGERVCKAEGAEVSKKFPVSAENAPYLCLDLAFQHSLLTLGLKVPLTGDITLVKQVTYKGEPFEAAWPLGAAINTLSARST